MLRNAFLACFKRVGEQPVACYATAAKQPKLKKSFFMEQAEEIKLEERLSAGFLVRTIGSSYPKWNAILEKHPELKTVKQNDVQNLAVALRELNYSLEDILSKPMILYSNALTIQNRYKVLSESGFSHINLSILFKYITVVNRTIAQLKSFGYIPFTVNVPQHLKACFTDAEISFPDDCTAYSEDMELREVRQLILNWYLRQRLGMNGNELEKMWKVYSRVRHKNYKSIQSMIQILIEDYKFTKERLKKHTYLLYGEPGNAQRVLKEINPIGGISISEIVHRRPKIIMSSCDALQQTLQHIKNFGIGDDAVLRCLEILTLGPETVLSRLRDIHGIEEFKVLTSNPRVLRLVHHQTKARMRLEYLNQLKLRCASLHILSCTSEVFARFARDGSDRTKGCDTVVFLAKIMRKDEISVRNILSRHPNWCHTPLIHIKKCYEYLIDKKFSIGDIFDNIHILLYPLNRIEEKMFQLHSTDLLEEVGINVKINCLSNSKILTLILYLIEQEFHFTGDGVWTEQHSQQVENFNNLLPDFPESLNKVCKYGVKPSNCEISETDMHLTP